MKFVIIVSLFIVNMYASNCIQEYGKYPTLTSMWTIRINNKVDIYGCKVIPIYAFLKDTNNIELMDAIDENPTILEPLFTLFKNKNILELIVKDERLKTILIDNAENKKFLSNMNYLFKKELNTYRINRIRRDSDYLQYFILAAANAKNDKQLMKYYKELQNISVDKIDALAFVSFALGNSYKFDYLLKNFFTLKKNLSSKQLTELVQYPVEFAYFLYPSKEDMNLPYGVNLYEKQKQFQKLIINIYTTAYAHYASSNEDENEMALSIVKNIYPYIVSQPNYNDIQNLLDGLIKEDFISDMYTSDDPCSDKSQDNYANLFGGDNLKDILRFKREQPNLYKELLDSESQSKNIISLFYISNIYNTFSKDKKDIFFNLLNDLGSDKYETSIVLKQLENIKYFDDVVKIWDYNQYVKASDDDLGGMSAPKYKFILTTSSYSQESPSVLDYLLENKIDEAKKSLHYLYGKRISELEDHRFTTKEKTINFANNMSNVIDAGLFVSGFFTFGTGWAALAAKDSAKFAAKKGAKMYAKRLALASRRLINKGVYHSMKARKTIITKLGKSNIKSFEKGLDISDNNFSVFQASMTIGALYFALPNNLEAKELCPKEER